MNFIFMVHTKVALENSKNCFEKCVILIAFPPASGRAWPPRNIKGKKRRRRRTKTNQNRTDRTDILQDNVETLAGSRASPIAMSADTTCFPHRHNTAGQPVWVRKVVWLPSIF